MMVCASGMIRSSLCQRNVGGIGSSQSMARLDGTGRMYTMFVDKKPVHFIFSDIYGPRVVDRNSQLIAQPEHSSLFWRAASLWWSQGKRIEDGLCAWRDPKHGEVGCDW